MAMLYFKGCPSCSKVIKDGDELKSAILNDNSVVREGKSSVQAYKTFKATSGHPKPQLSEAAKKIKSNDKMSFMIMNEGKQVTLDNIASDFQAETLPAQLEGQSNEGSSSPSGEGSPLDIVDPHSITHMESKSATQHEATSIDVEPSSPYNQGNGISADEMKHLMSTEPDRLLEGLELKIAGDLKAGEKFSSEINQPGKQELQFQGFEAIHSTREATSPPFVNKDFHEMDSIPRVPMHTLSKLIFGFNQSASGNIAHSRNEDVVVLFSSNWCGFCQRMELVVREVYRAIRGFMKMLKSGSGKEQAVANDETSMNSKKFPLIYLMDCTLNDCSLILKSLNQREVYPALVLFPAETETAISYEGDMSVANIIKFIANNGRNSHHLFSEKGLVWTTSEGGKNQDLFKDSSKGTAHEEDPSANEKFHEVILKNQNPKKIAKYNGAKSRTHLSTGSHKATSKVVVGSILEATDKLLNVIPFDKSRIIIVKADEDGGFQGLIFNKQIRWDALEELEEGLEFLKEAPLSFGGPVIRRGMPLVALTRRVSENQYLEVLPGIYFLDQLATLANIEELKARNQSINDYWFFLGYSSWGWNQLFDEIHEGAWTVSNDIKSLDWPLS
ncbi:hypothetical protein COLO4_08120 [Corchorus olitorius]|uniref:Thioredoxin domain-containing protein n=1 Tax=Corchorus olitorius TaxID=93759 RepID=A0A1R3KH73_9ROSI|nr:hypothetical protein COLO4_08120 [Corchorus olitorius]